jgi:holo-[acyl-carrier protein] synthase
MSIIAHGIDLVEIPRFAEMLDKHPERFLEKCFTAGERAYADANPKRRTEHLAARFAAKEAAMKALGTGWAAGITWQDVEVAREDSGAPVLLLHNAAATRAQEMGATKWLVSLTHTEHYAQASIIASAD